MIVTAGAIDCHVHFICPQLAYEAITSGEFSCNNLHKLHLLRYVGTNHVIHAYVKLLVCRGICVSKLGFRYTPGVLISERLL